MKKGNRTIGRPNFMGGLSDFTNAAKNRRGANAGADGKDGGALGGTQNAQSIKQGSLQGIEDTIPYNTKDVSSANSSNIII